MSLATFDFFFCLTEFVFISKYILCLFRKMFYDVTKSCYLKPLLVFINCNGFLTKCWNKQCCICVAVTCCVCNYGSQKACILILMPTRESVRFPCQPEAATSSLCCDCYFCTCGFIVARNSLRKFAYARY